MCGFAGEFLFQPGRADLDIVRKMADRLGHRGPDESGEFLSPEGRCAMASHRLAVIDPPHSQQPMVSPDGQTAIAFNGTLYNFRELRRQLEDVGATFQTDGDTEVLLQHFCKYGPEMFGRFTGMAAVAIYDGKNQSLLLLRDAVGQKPLHYAFTPDRIVFASEAKAVLAHHKVRGDLRRISITSYLTTGYIPYPESIYSDILKLPPGHSLQISDKPNRPKSYWKPSWISLPAEKAGRIELVRQKLRRSVSQRLLSDVPLGALLSGGVDSSIIVALMKQIMGNDGVVKTFTAGFEDTAYDERPMARKVAEHVGTDHTELIVRPDPSGAVDSILDIFDEPFADSSALPMHLICKAARQHVTVALAGDGGDEAFGGYDRYRALHLADTMGPLKYLAVQTAAKLIKPFAPEHERSWQRRLVRFAEALPLPPAMQYFSYRSLFSAEDLGLLLTDDFAASLDLAGPSQWFCELFESPDVDDEVSRAQHHDLATYLPDDLLVKADMCSMANGLELRAPMLDWRVLELGLSLPVEDKVSRHRGKEILREAFADVLPAEVLNQPKRGFGVPLAAWLRGPLAGEMRQTLLDPAVRDMNILRPLAVEGLVNDHLSGKRDYAHRLWALMVLVRWLARQK